MQRPTEDPGAVRQARVGRASTAASRRTFRCASTPPASSGDLRVSLILFRRRSRASCRIRDAGDRRRDVARRLFYTVSYMALIVFFAYFYTAIVFNPIDLADNMKKYAAHPAFGPARDGGVHHRTLTRITLRAPVPGVILGAARLFDSAVQRAVLFRADELLIVVGVALDTVRQMNRIC